MENIVLKGLRLRTGLNMVEFSKHFDIPYRTYQNWELGLRPMPEYVFKLLNRAVVSDQLEGIIPTVKA